MQPSKPTPSREEHPTSNKKSDTTRKRPHNRKPFSLSLSFSSSRSNFVSFALLLGKTIRRAKKDNYLKGEGRNERAEAKKAGGRETTREKEVCKLPRRTAHVPSLCYLPEHLLLRIPSIRQYSALLLFPHFDAAFSSL